MPTRAGHRLLSRRDAIAKVACGVASKQTKEQNPTLFRAVANALKE